MKFLLALSSLFLFSCSLLDHTTSSSILPEKRNTLSIVSGRYIAAIANKDLEGTTRLVLWEQYLSPENNDISAMRYGQIWVKVAEMDWPQGSHPLGGFKVGDVTSHENTATVTLVKDPDIGNTAGPQSIVINLQWTGGGWLVCGDNLFSKNGYFTNLVKNNGA